MYAEETCARTYQWFEDRINECIRKGFVTGEQFTSDVNAYREKQRQAKNRALKEKDENKNLDNAIEASQERELDEVINKNKDISSGVEVEEVKEAIKDYVSENVFKAWIAPNSFLDSKGKIIMVCKNNLTKDVIKSRYYDEICNALKMNGLNKKIEFRVESL